MSDDNEPLFELKMGNGPSLNEQYAKIEVQQQALQQEIDQGLHEPEVAKGMQPIRDKMEEDPSFEGLSEAEKNALARYVAEELLVDGTPNVKITDAYINPNDGEAEFEINRFTLVNFAPEVAYEKFIPRVDEPALAPPMEPIPALQAEMTPEQFTQHIQENFGMSREAAESMLALEASIDERFSDLSPKEKDYLFNRLVGGFVYEGFNWNSTAGDIGDLFPKVTKELPSNDHEPMLTDSLQRSMRHHEMFEALGMDKSEYDQLRYQVRVQNQIASGALEEWKWLEGDRPQRFLENYNQAYDTQLTDAEFSSIWNAQHKVILGHGDFAHQSITTATILHGGEWHDAARLWLGTEANVDDMAGWLGDAVLKTEKTDGWFSENRVQFGPDDYKADLDADNVTHLMEQNEWNFRQATNHYYNDYLAHGNSRATLFTEHTPYEDVEREAMRGLQIYTLEEIQARQPGTYNFLMSIKEGHNEMKSY